MAASFGKVGAAATVATVLSTAGAVPPEGLSTGSFVTIAGSKWEFTDEFDCWHHDVQTFPVQVWGQEGSEENREMCAQKCLEQDDCVAFNYPGPLFPDPNHKDDPQVCYLKRIAINSNKLGVHCEKAFGTKIWHYYTLLENSLEARLAKGLEEKQWPFFRPLQVTDQSLVRWIDGKRWVAAEGRACHGKEMSTTKLSSEGGSSDRQADMEECAKQCLANRECMGFEFPNFDVDKAWSSTESGEAACSLRSFWAESMQSISECTQGTQTKHWTFYSLADAWETKWGHHDTLDRTPDVPKWNGEKHGACDDVVERAEWLEPGSGQPMAAPTGAPCCGFTVLKCKGDTSKQCEPFMALPKGCSGVCKTPFTACKCWTQENLPVENNCCTKCELDCANGKHTCFPAGCTGPERMCESTEQIGEGAVCTCAARGVDPQAKRTPADVAAGWKPTKQLWQ